jgi:hypothetical protein
MIMRFDGSTARLNAKNGGDGGDFEKIIGSGNSRAAALD